MRSSPTNVKVVISILLLSLLKLNPLFKMANYLYLELKPL